MPIYTDAAYGGQSVTIENANLRVEVHKRLTGWGWAEVFAPSGRLMAVMEHFGEVKIPGLHVPLRMEAAEYQLERTEGGQRLSFPVRLTTLNEMVAASEFKRFVKSPLNEPALAGTAVLTLSEERPLLRMEYRFRLLADLGIEYLRGPWLKGWPGLFRRRQGRRDLPGCGMAAGRGVVQRHRLLPASLGTASGPASLQG